MESQTSQAEIADLLFKDKTAELYEKSNVCAHCEEPIESVDDAQAVEWFGGNGWSLYHRSKSCFPLALLAWEPKSGAGISPRAYRGRFTCP